MQIQTHKKTSSLALERFLADLITINYEAQKNNISSFSTVKWLTMLIPSKLSRPVRLDHTVVRERLLAKLSGANNFGWRWSQVLRATERPRSFPSGRQAKTISAGTRWMKVITSKSVSPAISLPPCNRQPTVTARYVRRWRKTAICQPDVTLRPAFHWAGGMA